MKLLALAGLAGLAWAYEQPYSTHASFQPFGRSQEEVIAPWELLGNAQIVSNEAPAPFLRLVPDLQYKSGAARTRQAVNLGESWQTEIVVRLSGSPAAPTIGDGIALWFTETPVERGPLFGAAPRYKGLGIFIDTYKNDHSQAINFPVIAAVVNDGTADVGSETYASPLHSASRCSIDRNSLHQVSQSDPKIVTFRALYRKRHLSIRYLPTAAVGEHFGQADERWVNCVDIENIDLTNARHWGASAITGAVSDNHDVMMLLATPASQEGHLEGDGHLRWSDVLPHLVAPPPPAVEQPPPPPPVVEQPPPPAPVVEQPPPPVVEQPPPPPPPAPQHEQPQPPSQPVAAVPAKGPVVDVSTGQPLMRRTETRADGSVVVSVTEASVDEAHEIDTLLQSSGAFLALKARLDEINNRLETAQVLIPQLQQIQSGIADALQKIRDADNAVTSNIASTRALLESRLSTAVAEQEKQANTWLVPFMGLCGVVFILTMLGVRQWKQIQKLRID